MSEKTPAASPEKAKNESVIHHLGELVLEIGFVNPTTWLDLFKSLRQRKKRK